MRYESDHQTGDRSRSLLLWLAVALLAVTGLTSTLNAQEAPDPGQQELPDGRDGESTGDDGGGDEATADKRDLEEKVVFELSGYHHFPSRSDLDELGAPAEISRLLREMARDSSRRPSLRLRAVDALAYYTDDQTREFLRSLLEEPSADLESSELRVVNLMRHHAIVSLAKAHDGDAVDTLAPLLDHDDVQLRLTVVSALAKHTGEAGEIRLEKFRSRATHDLVERELRKYLGDKDK